jgi:hypothetical protein
MRLLTGLALITSLLLTAGCQKRQGQAKTVDVIAELMKDDSTEVRPTPPPQPRVEPTPQPQPQPRPATRPKYEALTPAPTPPPPPPKPPEKKPDPKPKRVYKPEDAATRDRILAAVGAATGGYTLDEDDPAKPVIEVSFNGSRRANLSDAQLPSLEGLPNLITLRVCFTGITEASMPMIAKLTSLEKLDLNDNKRITDAAIMHLVPLVNLKRLDVRATSVTDAGVTQLRKALPRLIVLR